MFWRWLGQKPQVGSGTLFWLTGPATPQMPPAIRTIARAGVNLEQPEAGNLFATNRRRTIQVLRFASEQIGRTPIRLLRLLRGSFTPQCNGKRLSVDDKVIGIAFERVTASRAMIWSAGRAEKNSGGDRGPALRTVNYTDNYR